MGLSMIGYFPNFGLGMAAAYAPDVRASMVQIDDKENQTLNHLRTTSGIHIPFQAAILRI